MNPGFLDDMSWEMAEVYGAITDQILINLAKHFSFFEADNAPKSTFEYQARMLAQMGQVNKETTRIIRNNLADADLALQGVLEQAIIDAVKGSEPGLLKAVKSGILKPAGTPVVAPNQMRAFSLYYQQAADKLNLVNTVMLESTKSAYQQTISDVVSDIELSERMNATQIALDVATGETLTGVSSWNTALRHATDRLKDRGIIGFVDHGGHQWSAEAYVAMDIRTTVFNTGRAAVWETNQTFGNDLYIVSYHNGARPLCYDWQNKVISSTDNARVITDLYGDEVQVYAQSNTTYGEPAGLFGINCKHYPTPFIPGVSVIEGAPQDPEANAKTYAESQEQRRLERKLREEKRDLMMAKAQGRPQEEIDSLRERCRKSSADIDDFCNSTGRARHRDREAVYTKREFPDKEKYDVSKFEHQQKDLIDQYFKDGGAQQGYTFGEMTPNATATPAPKPPTPPTPPATPTPTPTAQNVASQSTQTTPNGVQSQTGTFAPAKTREQAEKYATDADFARSVSYSGKVSVDVLNAVNQELTELRAQYHTDPLVILRQNGRISANAQSHGGLLEFNGQKLTAIKQTTEEFRKSAKEILERFARDYPDGVPEWLKDTEQRCLERIKYSRWSVSSSYGTIKATIPHEYGHILSDQRFGMINKTAFCPTANEQAALEKVKLVKETFKRAKRSGDIYGISQYASTDADEFLAECFAARWMGETLPDYIVSMLEVVFG